MIVFSMQCGLSLQCRFHELSQFDDAKRSCRERLAHHNERRRKIPPDQQTEDPSQIPVVLQVKDRSPRQMRSLKTQRHSEVIKIAIPRNPTFKHFQIRWFILHFPALPIYKWAMGKLYVFSIRCIITTRVKCYNVVAVILLLEGCVW